MVVSGAPIQLDALLIGIVVSFVSAYACIHAFLKLVTRLGMFPFVVYRLLLGAGLIAFLLTQ